MDGPSHQADPASPSLSLVIPAYNEEAGIRQAIEEADEALARLTSRYEIIVVDDGSSDQTAEIVREASTGRSHIRLQRHQHNLGYSAALRTGFKAATYELVAFTDADCQFHLADLGSLLALTDDHPVAVGFRIDRKDPRSRRFFSWGYNLLVRTLLGTGVRDCDCALKVFRRDALMKLLPETQGFFVNTEMLTRARQLGYSVAETGVRHRPRLRGVSKVSLRDIPRTLATLLPFWWSRVMFPASVQNLHPDASSNSWKSWISDVGFWTVVVVTILLFFARIRSPLLEPDEARYAEIPRQMLHEGSWTVPVIHGQAYYHKPPLLYWLVMASYSMFGVEDWAARLVPCLASVAMVLVSYVWGRSLMNKRAALAGALILCLSSRFVYLGRMLTMDSLLCLWVLSSLALAHRAVSNMRSAASGVSYDPGTGAFTRPARPMSWTPWLLSALFCGLGLLTKGPVALVLVIVPVLAWQVLDGRTARATLRSWLIYISIAAGVAFPWYAAVAWRDPAFAREFFWTHHVLRFLAPIDHAEPFWFFIPGLTLGMLPWTLLLFPFARYLMLRSGALARRRSASLGFLLLTSLWCLLFFSLGGCKRPSYILPAMPPLALALGCYVDAIRLPTRRSFSFQRFPASWSLAGAGTFVILLLALHQLLPGYARKFSMRAQVRPNQYLSADPNIPVICYPHGWDSVSFYLRRNDVRVYPPELRRALIADLRSRPKTLVFVKSEKYLREFQRALPSSLEFVPRGRQGNVTAGLVQRRAEVPSTAYAQR